MSVAVAALLLAAPVLVFPVEPSSGVEPDLARRIGSAVIGAVGADASGPARRARRQQVDLAAQARGCGRDVFCLVEIARLLDAGRALVSRVRRTEAGTFALELLVLDGERAVLAASARPEVASEEDVAAAAAAVARRLLTPPDLELAIELDPPDAELRWYGERVERKGQAWWSGRWEIVADAPGRAPRREVWRLGPGTASRTVILELDPLDAPVATPSSEPFAVPSRRLGTGIGTEALAQKLTAEPTRTPSRFERPLPWVVTGVGLLTVATGVWLMLDANGAYADLAAEPRYGNDARSAATARRSREELRDRYRLGSGLGLGGGAAAMVGLGWLLLVPPEEVRP